MFSKQKRGAKAGSSCAAGAGGRSGAGRGNGDRLAWLRESGWLGEQVSGVVEGAADWVSELFGGKDEVCPTASGSGTSSGTGVGAESTGGDQEQEGPKTEEKDGSLTWPGAQASTDDKFSFYAGLIGALGHADAWSQEPGTYCLIGIRGLAMTTIGVGDYSDVPGAYDDMFVVLGLDEEGKPVVKEYPGSTDPGKFTDLDKGMDGALDGKQYGGSSENWRLQEGAYEYAFDNQHPDYWKDGYGGADRFRMTADQTEKGVPLYVDENQDDQFQGEGDSTYVQHDSAFLIHRAGLNPGGNVGINSAGCQVIAGKTADGKTLNMDDAAATLKQTRGGKFNYILLDGKKVVEAIKPAGASA